MSFLEASLPATGSLCAPQPRRRWVAPLLGAALGALLFILINTATSLQVTNDAWLTGGYLEPDIVQHYAGWLSYRQSPLTWPIGVALNTNFPTGLSVSFTDSIPVAAVFFRLLSPLLPATFQYFGLWALLCYMLQGAVSALLLQLFIEGLAPILLGSVLFIVSPVMVERAFRHGALAAHFLLLWGLYLYFSHKARRQQKQPALPLTFGWGWLGIAALSVSIHPYFLPMCYALLFAELAEYAWREKKLLRPALYLLCNFIVTLVTAAALGIFHTGGSSDFGFGYFTMNLNSLFNPASRGVVWSRFLPVLPQGLGSYDGFNYLGLGVIIGLLAMGIYYLFSIKTRLLPLLAQHWGLVLVSGCLGIYALSNVWVANSKVLISLPLPAKIIQLCNTFRSSGRMFWPVFYLLFLWLVVFIAKSFSRRGQAAVTLALAVLVGVQMTDISPALATKRAFFKETHTSLSAVMEGDAFWEAAPAHYSLLSSLDRLLPRYLSLALYAGQNGLVTNDTWPARNDIDAHLLYASETREAILAGQLESGTIYLTGDRSFFIQAAEALKGTGAICAQSLGNLYIIAPDAGLPPLSSTERFVPYENLPLQVVDYTDNIWQNGLLTTDPRIVAFTDDAVNRRYLDDAIAILYDGVTYPILYQDFKDEGWIMVTLDTDTAAPLCGQKLETIKATPGQP